MSVCEDFPRHALSSRERELFGAGANFRANGIVSFGNFVSSPSAAQVGGLICRSCGVIDFHVCTTARRQPASNRITSIIRPGQRAYWRKRDHPCTSTFHQASILSAWCPHLSLYASLITGRPILD